MLDGLLLIDKDPGMTSHDVVQRVRRLIHQKKVGHCGTLDPDATGLLILTLGKATRLTRFFIQAPKVYEGTVRFGLSTDTYDAAGEITAEGDTGALTMDRLRVAMEELTGTYPQTPPPFCAKKVKGVRFYELARRGEEVPVVAKEITVHRFEPKGELAEDRLPFELACGSGTYARTLAHELGAKCDCPSHLETLRRTSIGNFALDQAATLAQLAEAVETNEPPAGWIPFDAIELPFQQLTTDAQQERRLRHGQTIILRQLEGEEGDWIKLVNPSGQFIAVGSVNERIGEAGVGVVQPRIVFNP